MADWIHSINYGYVAWVLVKRAYDESQNQEQDWEIVSGVLLRVAREFIKIELSYYHMENLVPICCLGRKVRDTIKKHKNWPGRMYSFGKKIFRDKSIEQMTWAQRADALDWLNALLKEYRRKMVEEQDMPTSLPSPRKEVELLIGEYSPEHQEAMKKTGHGACLEEKLDYMRW